MKTPVIAIAIAEPDRSAISCTAGFLALGMQSALLKTPVTKGGHIEWISDATQHAEMLCTFYATLAAHNLYPAGMFDYEVAEELGAWLGTPDGADIAAASPLERWAKTLSLVAECYAVAHIDDTMKDNFTAVANAIRGRYFPSAMTPQPAIPRAVVEALTRRFGEPQAEGAPMLIFYSAGWRVTATPYCIEAHAVAKPDPSSYVINAVQCNDADCRPVGLADASATEVSLYVRENAESPSDWLVDFPKGGYSQAAELLAHLIR